MVIRSKKKSKIFYDFFNDLNIAGQAGEIIILGIFKTYHQIFGFLGAEMSLM
jgi:hypothetical protein